MSNESAPDRQQLLLMQASLNEYHGTFESLMRVTRDLDYLWSALPQDSDWSKRYRSEWFTLETVVAVLSDEASGKVWGPEYVSLVNEALYSLGELVRERLEPAPDAATPEARFVDSIRRAVDRSEAVVAAAETALVEGIDSPSLGVLAGQPNDEEETTERLIVATFEELGLDYPQRQPAGSSGLIYGLLARDSIRFEIIASSASYGGHEVRVFVNDRAVVGPHQAGLDPQRTFWPTNSLAATPTPTPAWVTRGREHLDDVSTYALISRVDDVVYWDWEEQWWAGGGDFGCAFAAAEYDREVARIYAETWWQSPADAVTRGVCDSAEKAAIEQYGLVMSRVGVSRSTANEMSVDLRSLDEGPSRYGLTLAFAWDERRPDLVIDEIRRVLATHPSTWRASYWTSYEMPEWRPPIAGRDWTRRP